MNTLENPVTPETRINAHWKNQVAHKHTLMHTGKTWLVQKNVLIHQKHTNAKNLWEIIKINVTEYLSVLLLIPHYKTIYCKPVIKHSIHIF